MHIPGIVVIGFATVQNPTGTVLLHKRTVRLPAADKARGADISLPNKYV